MSSDDEISGADRSGNQEAQVSSTGRRDEYQPPWWVDLWEPTPEEQAYMKASLEVDRLRFVLHTAISRLKRMEKLSPDEAAELARLEAEQETLRVDELRAYGIDPETLNQVFGNAEREACLADFVAKYGKAADTEDDGEQEQIEAQPDGA